MAKSTTRQSVDLRVGNRPSVEKFVDPWSTIDTASRNRRLLPIANFQDSGRLRMGGKGSGTCSKEAEMRELQQAFLVRNGMRPTQSVTRWMVGVHDHRAPARRVVDATLR
jgi:hypothetical protein